MKAATPFYLTAGAFAHLIKGSPRGIFTHGAFVCALGRGLGL
jgi:hypothetical protein